MRLAPLALAALLFTVAGCRTTYHAIVLKDGAPLYADEDRSRVVGHLERLDAAYIGHFRPDGDPVEVEVDGRDGWANWRDLRVFSVDEEVESRTEAVFRARRDVDLEGRDWPERVKRAIRDDRVESGMTREQVELAWGRPSSARPLDGGGERWSFERRIYDVYDSTSYAWTGGSSWYFGNSWYGYGYGRHWGYGPSYGWSYEWPGYQPVYTRTIYARTVVRSATFDVDGRVVGFESRED